MGVPIVEEMELRRTLADRPPATGEKKKYEDDMEKAHKLLGGEGEIEIFRVHNGIVIGLPVRNDKRLKEGGVTE